MNTRCWSTRAVHAGEDKRKPYSALTIPIVQTSTFTFANSSEILEFMHSKRNGGPPPRDEYSRYSNPTLRMAEHKLAALEGGERALLFASGMAAIATTLLALLSQGDHLLMVSDGYHRTTELARTYLSCWGIETTFVPIDQPERWEVALRPNTRLMFTETPTNPYLRVMDLRALVDFARRHQLLTIVDSTFATPVNLRPLEYGVNLVIHSATKYLGGHNDLLAGVVIGPAEILNQIEKLRGILGTISNPNEAYLLIRGLKTLALRIQRQNENGQRVAEYLASHPRVCRVYYPSLPSHPDHAVACRQMSGFGGVVSFEIDGDFARTARFIDLLRIPYIGPTLGGVESVVQQPAALFSLDPRERAEAGIRDNLVRYSLGIEDANDLIGDLEQALAQI
ncbi:MAG: aminotransferase class I/II-fold pyridoxal phosphate-dependent enzyme [Anaerolineae bacterium]|nr:aminotransferase class I/II-fold pyridoxal phosphate-dependent enzyme [Anaerolineae bacterium]MDW8068140.1 aminotransferase class I/II-fold pyridoxal phosphate-dependent enzyme [Anaerolineae bacterium]